MWGAATGRRGSFRSARLAGVSLLACAVALAAFDVPGFAQTDIFSRGDAGSNADDPRMALEADTLTLDRDRNTVTASGAVKIDYQGNRLVADSVTYDQETQRLMARGNVEIVEEDGNIIHADEVDVTDDFRDGFVNALQVETPEKTYFSAESAQREGGRTTTFNSGVYTACEPCREQPGKAPLWQVKSRRIIWDQKEKTIRFRNATFEFFGLPIAYLPVFQTADPSVKRKTGFLAPTFQQSSELGYGLTIPYYLALAPTYDMTVSLTPYSRQGFVGEAEWRQQFDHGEYSLTAAGIMQQDPEAWRAGRVNASVTNRAMLGTKGRFEINPRWTFGWDVLLQTDKNFSYTYGIQGFGDYRQRSEIYLRGLNDRNYFDLRAMRFHVQEDIEDRRDERQAWALPSFDYAYTPDEPVAGGELNIDMNLQSLYRDQIDYIHDDAAPWNDRLPGPAGSNGRLTAEAEWRRSFVTDGGLVLTPLLAARGDAIYADYTGATTGAIAGFNNGSVASDIQSAYWRYMATAGLEARWPILFSSAWSSQVIEPMAQLFVRPDAPYQSTLGIPNEDAQSMVFDATSLFERDKFSGYDRIEGGTRANLGFRYSGTFGDGWTTNAIFGQSYHLAGDNPYDAPDLVNAGAYSGLDSDVSDFVGLFGVTTPYGLSASLGGRFDEETLEVRRSDVRAGYSAGPLNLSMQYSFIQAQPRYGFPDDRREVSGRANLNFADDWYAFGDATYDLERSVLVRNTLGIAYQDECFIYAMSYEQDTNARTKETEHTIGVRVSLRTLGDFGSKTRGFGQTFQ